MLTEFERTCTSFPKIATPLPKKRKKSISPVKESTAESSSYAQIEGLRAAPKSARGVCFRARGRKNGKSKRASESEIMGHLRIASSRG